MSFVKALPVLSGMLGEESFRIELKKMKAEQDGLERRMWAKSEKIKADHMNRIKVDKDVARISRRPITPEKEKEWTLQLQNSLQQFYLHTCLPAMDGLSNRQRQRLKDLGVPGLGDGEWDRKSSERVKRIMDVLEGGMED
ncbi:hypothetical protein TREMEDRAFT_69381 [Tremella mesenterica DSM 1558]|nr:uncharacterized protein TREMEDRAFT_69381 [Tremella mesenterica DSM 1558]EIW68457.1 hypothetical protein TREMEDRAFT_69381 [Tremella mesenterica DSM 1558]